MRINQMAERVANFIYTRKYRKSGDVVRFTEVSRDLKACLICMPSKLELIKPAAEILPIIASTFPNRNIKILLTSSIDPQSHEIIRKFVVINAVQNDYDRFSMPKREFLSKLYSGGLGMTLDMDIRPNFFHALIALHSGASVRAAINKGIGLPYYNLLIGKPSIEDNPKLTYQAMAEVLQNFRM